jgi:hypothetical protein
MVLSAIANGHQPYDPVKPTSDLAVEHVFSLITGGVIPQPETVQMRSLLFGAAALLIVHNALSAESYVLKHDSPEGSWHFDIASIVIVNDSIRRSQMSLYLTSPLQDQPTGNHYDQVIFTYEHDCKADRMRVIDTVPFLQGKRVTMGRASHEWRPAAESAAHKYACALVQQGEAR